VDGPAGSGKSTISYKLAERFGYLFVDTGVFYRAMTLLALRRQIPLDDHTALTEMTSRAEIQIIPTENDVKRPYRVLIDGEDVSDALRSPDVEQHVSTVSAIAGVRQALVMQQREIAAQGNIIMAGRDIGTVVLPDADVKLYIDASLEERARRRYIQQQEKGQSPDLAAIQEALRQRDRVDSEREVSPLRRAPDAFYIETDNKSVETVVDEVATKLESWQPV
jgi:cytidylate kinase